MATKLGEAFIEVTARDAKLKVGLDKARRQAEAATTKPVQLGMVGDFRETVGTMKQLSAAAVDIRSRMFQAVPGSAQFQNLGIALKDTNDRLATTKAHLRDLIGNWKTYAAVAAVAVGAIVVALRDVVRAGMEAEDATVGLMAALAGQGALSKESAEALDKWGTAQMEKTVYDDEAIKNGMALLLNYGRQTSELKGLSKAAMAYATIQRVDLQTAYQAVGSAVNGMIRGFSRLIPEIKKVGTEHERLALILAWGEANFSKAEARARTTSGAFQQFAMMVNEAKEALAEGLMPILRMMSAPIMAFVKWLGTLSEGTRSWVLALTAVGVGAGILFLGLVALAAAWSSVAIQATLAAIAMLTATEKAWAIAGFLLILYGTAGKLKEGFAEARKELDALRREFEKGQRAPEIKGPHTPTEAEIDAVKELKEQRKEAATAAREAYEKMKTAQEAWARGVLGEAKAIRQLKAAHEEAQRAAIGWTTLGDLWRKAMTAGVMQRFMGPNRPTGPLAVGDRSLAYSGAPGTVGFGPYGGQEIVEAIRSLERKTKEGDEAVVRKLMDLAPRWAI